MREDTRARLLAAGRRHFGAVGFADANMDRLCAEAGLTRGALYHHFGSKEGLLEAVVRQLDGEMRVKVDQGAEAQPDLWDGFRASCLAYLLHALDPEYQRIVLQDAPAALGERMRQIDHQLSLGPMAEVLRRLMADGILMTTDPEALALMLNGGLIDAAIWIAAEGAPDDRQRRAEKALLTILSGLKA